MQYELMFAPPHPLLWALFVIPSWLSFHPDPVFTNPPTVFLCSFYLFIIFFSLCGSITAEQDVTLTTIPISQSSLGLRSGCSFEDWPHGVTAFFLSVFFLYLWNDDSVSLAFRAHLYRQGNVKEDPDIPLLHISLIFFFFFLEIILESNPPTPAPFPHPP